MTREEIKALSLEGIEERCAVILTEMETEGADLETLSAEVGDLEERKAQLIEEREKIAKAVIEGEGKIIEKVEEKRNMTFEEVRSSEAYLNAYVNYLKTNDDTEARSVLTENGVASSAASAGVPVPTYVEERIKTAWENDEIMSRVDRSEIKGNLKIGFELSATAAGIHAEGADAPSEETLNLGIVTLVPETIKKWITVSDETIDANGQAFIDYIFDEIEYQIVKKAADVVVADIVGSPSTATKTAPAVATVASTGIADVINALALLSDEATNPVIIMNKTSYAYYKGLALSGSYAVDPFDGLTVLFNNTLDSATDTPASGVTNHIMIVGDLKGERVNFTNGTQPTMKFDDLSLAEEDLVKVVGRLPMGHGVVASGRFAVVTKTGA